MAKKKSKSNNKPKQEVAEVKAEEVAENVNRETEALQAEATVTADNVVPEEKKEEKKVVEKKSDDKKVNVKQDKKKDKKEKGQNKVAKKTKETFSELKKVSWPTFGQVVKKTGVVLAVVIIFTVVLFGIDYLLGLLFDLLTSGIPQG